MSEFLERVHIYFSQCLAKFYADFREVFKLAELRDSFAWLCERPHRSLARIIHE
ncbi:hypothetical protein BH23BAC3_BH23BAC3_10420 [soil metagenome]